MMLPSRHHSVLSLRVATLESLAAATVAFMLWFVTAVAVQMNGTVKI